MGRRRRDRGMGGERGRRRLGGMRGYRGLMRGRLGRGKDEKCYGDVKDICALWHVWRWEACVLAGVLEDLNELCLWIWCGNKKRCQQECLVNAFPESGEGDQARGKSRNVLETIENTFQKLSSPQLANHLVSHRIQLDPLLTEDAI